MKKWIVLALILLMADAAQSQSRGEVIQWHRFGLRVIPDKGSIPIANVDSLRAQLLHILALIENISVSGVDTTSADGIASKGFVSNQYAPIDSMRARYTAAYVNTLIRAIVKDTAAVLRSLIGTGVGGLDTTSGDLRYLKKTGGLWKVYYTDGSGVTQELSLGSAGQVLQSTGTTSPPTWGTAGIGDVLESDSNITHVTPYWVLSKNYISSITGAQLENVWTANGILVRTGSATYTTITDNTTNWNTAYTYRLSSASGTSPLTLSLSASVLSGSIDTSSSAYGLATINYVNRRGITGTALDAIFTSGVGILQRTGTGTYTVNTTGYQAADADLTTISSLTPYREIVAGVGGAVTQVALGNVGTFWRSNGVASLPTFSSITFTDVSGAQDTANTRLRTSQTFPMAYDARILKGTQYKFYLGTDDSIHARMDSLGAGEVTEAVLHDSVQAGRVYAASLISGITGVAYAYEGQFNAIDKNDTITIAGAKSYDSYTASAYANALSDTVMNPLSIYPDSNRVFVTRPQNNCTRDLKYTVHRLAGILSPPTGVDATSLTDGTKLRVAWTTPATSASATARPMDSIVIGWSKLQYRSTIAAYGDSVKRVAKTAIVDTIVNLTANTKYYVNVFDYSYADEISSYSASGSYDTCTTGAPAAGAVMLRDSVSDWSASYQNLAVSLTITNNANRVLWVWMARGTAAAYAGDSCYYGTQKMTLIDSTVQTSLRLHLYELINPTVGTANVTAYRNTATQVGLYAVCYSGVNQTTAHGTVAVNKSSWGTAPTLSITSAVGDTCIGRVFHAGGPTITFTSGVGQNNLITRYASSGSPSICVDTKGASGAATTISWTMSGNNGYAASGFAIKKAD